MTRPKLTERPPAVPAQRASRGMFVAFCVAMACAAGFAIPAASASSRQSAALALQQADEAVSAARERNALWTTAVEALNAARAAHAREDFAQARRHARIAIEQAQLGIAQRSYPPLRF